MSDPRPLLPNFLLVGAAKSGTTSFYHYLKRHPGIYFSPVKEPCHFSARCLQLPQCGPDDWRKTFTPRFEDYARLFTHARPGQAIGEASVDTLTYWECTIPLIQSTLGDPRILILLRDPVERAYSAWQHLVRDGRETASFEEGLRREEERRRQNWNAMWHYASRGLYHRQVRAFLDSFSRVRVFLYDDFRRDPAALLRQAFEFLDVDPDLLPERFGGRFNAGGLPRWKRLNAFFVRKSPLQRALRTAGSRLLGEDRWRLLRDSLRARLLQRVPMKEETRRQLREYFRDDVARLQEMLGRDLGAWMS